MTEEYRKRLIELAKEVIELNKPINLASSEESELFIRDREIMFCSKLNYLLGYIMALENHNLNERGGE